MSLQRGRQESASRDGRDKQQQQQQPENPHHVDPRIERRIKEVRAPNAGCSSGGAWKPTSAACAPFCPVLQLRERAKAHLATQEFAEALSCLDLAIDLNSSSYKVMRHCRQGTRRAEQEQRQFSESSTLTQ